MKKYAFTLAEVLVTLGIIGVVSAMTVPSLMQNYQRQSYVVQLHKIYNEVSQALLQYQTEKNAVDLIEAGLRTNADLQTFTKKYLKVVSQCAKVEEPCFGATYKTMAGTTVTDSYMEFNHDAYVLASGAAIRPLYSKLGDKIVNLCVDINGQKGPNIVGRDMFFMAVYKNGVIDSTGTNVVSAPLTEAQRDTAGVMWIGFSNILNDNWQMTY